MYKGIWEAKGFEPSFGLTIRDEDLSGYLSFWGAPVRTAVIQGGNVFEGRIELPFQESPELPDSRSGTITGNLSEDGNTIEGMINLGVGTDRNDYPITLTRKVNPE